jgi:hypothetical protein
MTSPFRDRRKNYYHEGADIRWRNGLGGRSSRHSGICPRAPTLKILLDTSGDANEGFDQGLPLGSGNGTCDVEYVGGSGFMPAVPVTRRVRRLASMLLHRLL